MKRIAQFLLLPNITLAEAANAVLAVVWGVWVGNALWDVFPTANLYSAFAIMPEWAWGVAAITLGGIQLMAIANEHWRLRRATSMTMVLFWIFVSAAFVLSDWRSTATAVYPFVVLSNVRAYLRLQLTNPAGHKKRHE